MKYLIYIFTLFSLLLLSGCAEKFSGKSEEAYNASKLVIESKLDAAEKIKLEKALRVIVLHALQVKWDEAKKYKGKSFDDITLDVVDNKTYDDVIDFSEDYLEKTNKRKIDKLTSEITKLENEKKAATKTIEMLALIKTTDIRIIQEESFGEKMPYLKVTLKNTSNFDLVDAYKIDVDAVSISQNIPLTVDWSGQVGGHTIEKGGEIIEKNSLSFLMELSKKLTSKLKSASYPITNLVPLDLEVSAKATVITTSDGKHYEYPDKELAEFDRELESLNKERAMIKSLKGELSEFVLTDPDKNSGNNVVFNEKYAGKIKAIREKSKNTASKAEEQQVNIDKNLSIKLPKGYEAKKRKFSGMSSFSLSEDLSFDSDDKALNQFQIRDAVYREYISDSDKAHGQFRALYKPNVNFDIKKHIEDWKTPINSLVEADDSGYITLLHSSYELTRYFKFKGTHYLYTMAFKSLEECIAEFDRSRTMVKQ